MDGRVDLLVSSYDTQTHGFRLHILRNQCPGVGNWIGVRLVDVPGRSVIGARVKVSSGGRIWTRQVVTGDSFTAQHPAIVHFGLGEHSTIDRLEIRWQDGKLTQMEKPAPGQYHLVEAQD
jgi:hypothetical protein